MPAVHDLQSDTHMQRPLVIAHRGASGLAPENTLAAFRLALALGADGVEMDVQMSADGWPVVIHDARVNRTTDGEGSVSRLTVDQFKRLDAGRWFDRRLSRRPRVRAMAQRIFGQGAATAPRFSGEPVPSLEEALLLLTPAPLKRIYIELKGNPAHNQALLEAVLSLVREFRVDRSVTLLSFDHAIVRRAKELARDIRTAATFPVRGRRLISTRSIIRAAEKAGVDEVALHFGLANKRSVGALHDRGLSVSVWTVNSKIAMRRLAAAGVDAIMTDFPNRLLDFLDALEPKRLRWHKR